MALYLVVWHQQDKREQQWVDVWLDDDRLQSITTTSEIGRFCASAKSDGERVYIHRCGWGGVEPRVCCSVIVSRAVKFGSDYLVEFTEPVILGHQPPVQAGRGQNYYEADPV
jgi:hypothetical protein